jgi:hypothetical protein
MNSTRLAGGAHGVPARSAASLASEHVRGAMGDRTRVSGEQVRGAMGDRTRVSGEHVRGAMGDRTRVSRYFTAPAMTGSRSLNFASHAMRSARSASVSAAISSGL